VRWSRRVTALLLIALLLPTVIGLTQTASADTGADATQATPALAAPLPYTDGDGLLAPPPAFTKLDFVMLFAAGKDACSIGCATPFGTVLGSADGVPGQSNCAPTCIHPEYSFLDLTTGEVSVHRQDPHDANLRYRPNSARRVVSAGTAYAVYGVSPLGAEEIRRLSYYSPVAAAVFSAGTSRSAAWLALPVTTPEGSTKTSRASST
jgi:hypothetical protein